jgi:hypothetical protein
VGRKGGKRRRIFDPAKLEQFTAARTSSDLFAIVTQSLSDLRGGLIDAKTANAVGSLATVAQVLLKTSTLEERITKLETARRWAMPDLEKRVEQLEAKQEPQESDEITIDVQHNETVVGANGEKYLVQVPATYDENAPFNDIGNGARLRVRYPVSEGVENKSKGND